ncbi:MAG: DsbA family protein [Bifidobacterium sp.]|nr:DsbA family protein [Bifidobacterium sp.]
MADDTAKETTDKDERQARLEASPLYDKIQIFAFTDPLCTWCWGSEPVLRALETRYPGEIVVHYIMGGLVKDYRQMHDPANGIGDSDTDTFNKQVGSHWQEASSRHGMPVTGDFHLFSDEYPSSYPQNIAYEAARLTDPEHADQFLYLLRKASAADGELTSHEDVLVRLAGDAGIPVGPFLKALHDGSAEQAFQGDMKIAAAHGVHGFPTFIVQYRDKSYLLRGFNDLDTFEQVIAALTGGQLKPVAPKHDMAALEALMDKHPVMAMKEIQEALGLHTLTEAKELAQQVVDDGKGRIEHAGNGEFLDAVKLGGVCDATTGVCTTI